MTEEVQDYNDVQGLIQHAMDQDFNKANKIFGDIMTLKVQDMLDQEKIRLADQIYNDVEPEEEPDDEQLELDLEDDNEESEDLEEYEFGTEDHESEEEPKEEQ